MKLQATLFNAQQGHQCWVALWSQVKASLMAGHRLTVEVHQERRSLSQNDHIHPLVRAIAKQAGRKDEDTLRALLVEQWRSETKRPRRYQPSLDGLRMVDVSNSTKDLDKPDASEFIDWLYAWAVENGVELTERA